MPDSKRRIANKLLEFADFLRDEYLDPNPKHFDGWPGLPRPQKRHDVLEKKPRIKLKDAHLYLLGCCVDMMEHTWRVWSKATKFCEATVPRADRNRIWNWIARHPLEQWMKRKKTKAMIGPEANKACDLHRYAKRHKKVHEIASILVNRYGGDPRKIWDRRSASEVLRMLEDELAVGPQIARMTLGGLRDHKIVRGKSDFKADIYVCRVMKRLGLSPTYKPDDVIFSGRKWFRGDSWRVDGTLWELGKDYNIKSLKDFRKVYKDMQTWKEIRLEVQGLVKSLDGELKGSFNPANQWAIEHDPTHHWAGIYLKRTNGALRMDMEDIAECELWAWVGVGLYQKLVIAVDVGGLPKYFPDVVTRFCRDNINKKEERQTSSGRWGMREFYRDYKTNENDLLDRTWLLRNLTAQLKRAQRVIMTVESTFRTKDAT